VEKRVINGMVGIVTSNTYGSGWAAPYGRFDPARAFCPALVDAMAKKAEHAEIIQVIKDNFPEFSKHGRDPFGLSLNWIQQGAEFRVVDCDGAEGIILKDRERRRYMTA